MKVIIFFDINGTIIKRDARTDIPFELSIDEFLDRKGGMAGIDTSARSDMDVFGEVLRKFNMGFSELQWQHFLGIYKNYLVKYEETNIWQPNVDIKVFLKKLKARGCKLGLISGEVKIGAEFKLKKIGLWEYFICGGFGEDGLKRVDIAKAALARAEKMFDKKNDRVIIIGDTIKDINTARALNAEIVSIATGSDSYDELAKHQPDSLVRRFDEIDLARLLDE